MSQPFSLETYRWQNRLIVLFAPSPDHPFMTAQLKNLAEDQAGLEARDLILLQVFASSGQMGDEVLSSAAVNSLRQQFKVEGDTFSLLLIGKDSGVKRRSAEPVPREALFAQIDGMPMRQREMRERT